MLLKLCSSYSEVMRQLFRIAFYLSRKHYDVNVVIIAFQYPYFDLIINYAYNELNRCYTRMTHVKYDTRCGLGFATIEFRYTHARINEVSYKSNICFSMVYFLQKVHDFLGLIKTFYLIRDNSVALWFKGSSSGLKN